MTVENPTNKTVPANGDGIAVDFPYLDIKLINFEQNSNNDLQVFIIDSAGLFVLQTIVTDYSQTYDDDTESGKVTFVTPPTALEQVFMIRERILTQPFDIPINSDFDAEKIEIMSDNLSVQISDISEEVGRSLKAPPTFTGTLQITDLPVDDNLLVYTGNGGNMANSGTTLTEILAGSTDAAASAVAAANSASAASTSASNASTSETNAATSESNASTSETNAATSAGNAATSETNAGTSESNASTSATNAATSETNAGTSETNAGISETNAAASAVAAANSAATNNLPTLGATDTGQLVQVNAAGDGYDLSGSGTSGQLWTSNGSDTAGSFQDPPAGGGGKILQVITKKVASAGTQSSTSTAYTDITSASVAITPSNTANSILIFGTITGGMEGLSVSDRAGFAIRKGTTEIQENFIRSVDTVNVPVSLHGIDAPNTTSSVTYKLSFRRIAGSGTAKAEGSSVDSQHRITVMEIAG